MKNSFTPGIKVLVVAGLMKVVCLLFFSFSCSPKHKTNSELYEFNWEEVTLMDSSGNQLKFGTDHLAYVNIKGEAFSEYVFGELQKKEGKLIFNSHRRISISKCKKFENKIIHQRLILPESDSIKNFVSNGRIILYNQHETEIFKGTFLDSYHKLEDIPEELIVEVSLSVRELDIVEEFLVRPRFTSICVIEHLENKELSISLNSNYVSVKEDSGKEMIFYLVNK